MLVLLMAYVLAGTRAVPFHADEADHLFKARDSVIYFVLRDPDRLRVEPPVAIDSEEHIRLLTGTTSAYLTGLILWHSGTVDLADWPAAWYYPQSPAENRAAGRVPPDRVLHWGRLGSTLMTMGAVLVMYGLGTRLNGRGAGLMAALLFAVHPVVLINGRRVMQEGALMLFALLVLWLGIRVYEQPSVRRAVIFGIVIGLALASKPTLLIGVVGVIVGLGILVFKLNHRDTEVIQRKKFKKIEPQRTQRTQRKNTEGAIYFLNNIQCFTEDSEGRESDAAAKKDRHTGLSLQSSLSKPLERGLGGEASLRSLCLCGSILFCTFTIYLLMTPAIWSNPIARTRLAAEMRREVLQGQAAASPDAYKNRLEQGLALITMPFPHAIQYFESPDFARDTVLQAEIRHYQNSLWRGIILPAPVGLGLAAVGIYGLLRSHTPAAKITLIWMLVIAAGIRIAVPLGWQRYYLLWTIAVILCAGVGLKMLIHIGLKRVDVSLLA